MRNTIILLLFCFLGLVVSGCAGPKRDVLGGYEVYEAPDLAVERFVVGKSVENRPIECFVLGLGHKVILIMAGIHGSEQAGIVLSGEMIEHLGKDARLLENRKVVILPAANPDGVVRNSRFNARGVDLNRNFATANRINNRRNGRRALSEPESRTIEKLINEYKPDRIVTVHQPLSCIDYDGPGEKLAERMAEFSDLPVKKIGALSGSLGSYAGLTLGIPVITLELRGDDSRLNGQLLWERYGRMLIAAVVYPDKWQ